MRAIDVWRQISTYSVLDDALAEVRAQLANGALAPAERAEMVLGEALCLCVAARCREAAVRLDDAARAFAELDDGPEVRYGRTVLAAAEGAFAAFHGQQHAAMAHFQRAMLEAEPLGSQEIMGALHLLRAEHLGHLDPRLAYADARTGADLLAIASRPANRERSRRILAAAALAAGEPEVTIIQAEVLLADRTASPIDTARMRVLLGRALYDTGRKEESAALIHAGLRQLEPFNAALWQVEALRAVICTLPAEGAAAARQARDLLRGADASVIDNLLWNQVPKLELRTLGEQTITVDNHVMSHRGDDAARLVFVLALAAPRRLDATDVAELLWPGKDPQRQASSLTTLTWEARHLLGLAAWRLIRDGNQLWLDLDGASFDLRDTAAEMAIAGPGADEAAARLCRPLLPAWQYDTWVLDADARRRAALHDGRHRHPYDNQ